MPKELKVFQAEFASLQKQAEKIYEEDKVVDSTDAHFGSQRLEAIEAITVRVQELKDQGVTGTTIKDFLGDAETKKYYQTGLEFVDKAKQNYERGMKNREVAKKLVANLKKLEADLRKEAAARKKKLIGKESQSAPEMVKLADAIPPFLAKPGGNMGSTLNGLAGTPFPFAAAKKFEAAVDKGIKGTADNVKAQQAQQMMKQSLNVRLLAPKVTKFKVQREKVKTACLAALKAVAAKNSAEAKKQLNDALAIVEGMDSELKPLHVAYKEYEEWIKGDKVGAKIVQCLGDMTASQNAALKEVQAVQSKMK